VDKQTKKESCNKINKNKKIIEKKIACICMTYCYGSTTSSNLNRSCGRCTQCGTVSVGSIIFGTDSIEDSREGIGACPTKSGRKRKKIDGRNFAFLVLVKR
jgi:ferredoxin-like protein FixX